MLPIDETYVVDEKKRKKIIDEHLDWIARGRPHTAGPDEHFYESPIGEFYLKHRAELAAKRASNYQRLGKLLKNRNREKKG